MTKRQPKTRETAMLVARMQARIDKLEQALREAGYAMCGMCYKEDCLRPCEGRQAIIDALGDDDV